MNGVSEAVERARNGEGPSIIEAKTYRSKGHSKSDAKKYRTREEEKEWLLRDPIKLMAEVLIEQGIFTQQEADQTKAEAKKEIEESVEFAKNSPEPTLDALMEDIYA